MRSEQRQHINLSDYANGIIEADIVAFRPDLEFSGFVNHVVQSFWEASDASIEQARIRKRLELVESITKAKYRTWYPKDTSLSQFEKRAYDPKLESKFRPSDAELETIDLILNEHVQSLRLKAASYPKGTKPKKIRLRNEVFDMLYPECGDPIPDLKHYEGNAGRYLKALVEDYARKPFVEREAIVFGDVYRKLIDEIALPASERHVLTVSQAAYSGNKGRTFDVKPYALTTDVGGNYHYLVGLSKEPGEAASAYRPASFRISRIGKVKSRSKSYGTGSLTKAQEKSLLSQIEKKGVAYLLGDLVEQKVLLTPNGARLYDAILHLRPTATNAEKHSDGSRTLKFDCTENQMKNYFQKFGADALILEPKSLTAEFEEHYRTALAAYSDASNAVQ